MQGAISKVMFIALLSILFAPRKIFAETLQLTILPKSDLRSGRVTDGTELALIKIMVPNENCSVSIWDDSAQDEGPPGQYTLHENKNGKDTLNVKLTGEDWRPNISSGKGVHLIRSTKTSTLRLITLGEQTINSNIWNINLSAQCRANYLINQEARKLINTNP